MEKILNEIREERQKQNQKWGEQNHSPMEWIPIIMEELGEASKEAVDFHFEYPVKNDDPDEPTSPADQSDQQMRLDYYREELIQTAAVIVQAVECFDRNGMNHYQTRWQKMRTPNPRQNN